MGVNIFSVLCFFAMVAFIYFANDICRVHWSFKWVTFISTHSVSHSRDRREWCYKVTCDNPSSIMGHVINEKNGKIIMLIE